MKRLKLRKDQVREVADYYRAVEHVGKVLEAKKKQWSQREMKKRRSELLDLLHRGEIETLSKKLSELGGKIARKESRYFAKRVGRMEYAKLREERMPIGSGAIESAIRRVVNLRLKSPATYWKASHAEEMLLLRSYAKSGRWECLEAMAFGPPGWQTRGNDVTTGKSKEFRSWE